jgi:hypothetical protein
VRCRRERTQFTGSVKQAEIAVDHIVLLASGRNRALPLGIFLPGAPGILKHLTLT